jgi:hypothetical protein
MKIVLTPDWFLTSDVIIEGFSFIVLLLFFLFSIRSYKLSKNKNSFYLGIGFFLIALAEASTILTKLVLYYPMTAVEEVGRYIVTYNMVHSVDIFYYIGFFFHKLFTLVGLYIIYRLPLKNKISGDVFISIAFIIISALFSNSAYYLFHLVALIFLILIIANYYRIYNKTKLKTTELLIISFVILAVSQILFILSKLGIIYAVAQIMQLASYIILLALMIKIVRHSDLKWSGKETGQT